MLREKEWNDLCRDSSILNIYIYIYFDPLLEVSTGCTAPHRCFRLPPPSPETSHVDSEAVGEVDDYQQPYAIFNLKVSTYMYDNMTI